MSSRITVADLAKLPPTLTVAKAAEIMAVAPDSIYDACKRGEFPHVRIGARIVIPTLKLGALLGLEVQPTTITQPGPAAPDEGHLRRIS